MGRRINKHSAFARQMAALKAGRSYRVVRLPGTVELEDDGVCPDCGAPIDHPPGWLVCSVCDWSTPTHERIET